MTGWYDLFLHVNATFPRWAVAVVLGFLLSWAVTHAVKFWLLPIRMRANQRHAIAVATAFLVGAGGTFVLLPTLVGSFLAVMIGTASPMAYRLMIVSIQHRYPWLADVLSADVRGMLFGRFQSSQKPRTTP